MSQVAGPFSPRVRWLLDSPVDIRMTRRRLSRGLRWMDHRARKSENLREVTDSSTLHSPYWSTRSFGNLLNPIAVRIIFVPKLSLEARVLFGFGISSPSSSKLYSAWDDSLPSLSTKII